MLYWLASYPKSGSTWVRAFLTQYLNPDEDVCINHLLGQPVAVYRSCFDSWVGTSSSLLHEHELESYRPDFHRFLGEESDFLLVKTHEVCGVTRDSRALFPTEGCGGTVYIVRHPFDVVTSWAYHQQSTVQSAVDFLNDEGAILNRQDGFLHTHFPEPLGDWSQHNLSWLQHAPRPLLVVRYEDLVLETAATFRMILEHCSLEYNEVRLCETISRTSFESLSAQEQLKGYRGRQPSAPSFFRKGRIGDGCRSLAAPLAKEIWMHHRAVMTIHGYAAQRNVALEPELTVDG